MRSDWLVPIGGAVAGGFVVGVATSFGQGLLPDVLAPLANSSTSWSLAAFALAAWLGRGRLVRSVVVAVIAFLAMLLGYDVTTIARGFAISLSMGLFWAAAAVFAGPALGIGAAWIQGREPLRIGAGVAPIAGIAAGEALYGLTVIAATTPTLYWSAQLALAVGGVAWVGARTRSPAAVGAAIVLTAIAAGLFYVLYSSL